MKRFIVLLIITALCIVGCLSARGIIPSINVFGPGTGLVLEFFETRAGLITAIAVPVALALLFFGGAIFRIGGRLLLAIFAPVIDEEKRINRTLTRQIETNEKKLDATEKALKEFTTAVEEYARHLSSHNSAARGLSGASDEMNTGNEVQHRFLEHIMRNTEERLDSKEALLATLKSNMAPPEEPDEPAPANGVSAPKKSIPSYRDLHPLPPQEEKPDPEVDKEASGQADLVEAMVLPYYRALDELDAEKSAEDAGQSPYPEKTTAEAKKAVEAIMLPLYRTLYQSGDNGDASIAEKQDETAAPPSRRKSPGRPPPGCARRHYPQLPG
jgi:hypothetical protein